MKKKDFSDYKVRASCLGKVMTPAKGKSNLDIYRELVAKRDNFQTNHDKLRDGLKSKETYRVKIEALNIEIENIKPYKDEIQLSATAKEYLREVWIEEVWERSKEIHTKYMEKGNLQEETSLSLITHVRDKLYMKNDEKLENEWVCGTPDFLPGDPNDEVIPDVKTKWDIFGFMQEDGRSSDYDWQVWCYMWLGEKPKGELLFTLVDTPEHLIFSEFTKAMHREGFADGSVEALELENLIRKNHTYSDIAEEERLKVFNFEFRPERIERVKKYVMKAREYLNSLTLNGQE